jgi:hypothetical protein
MRSTLLPDHHKNHLIWVDSSLMVFLPWAASFKVQPPAWIFREPSDLSGLDQNIPHWLAVTYLWVPLWDGWHILSLCISLYKCSPIKSSIIVLYSDPGNVFQVFCSHNWKPINNNYIASQ